ncbi:MAG: hypothetical protein QW520_01590 [Methanomassiliicoccales archaeon]
MKELKPMHTDILVVGHGASGLLAASALAKDNNVLVVGRGTTATSLSTGCISYVRKDILRQERNRIDLGALALSVHPFNDIIERGSLSLEEILPEVSRFFLRSLSDQGLEMTDDAFNFFDMLTNAGNIYSCSIAPYFTASGRLDRMQGQRMALLGLEGFRDLDSRLVALMCESRLEDIRVRAHQRRLRLAGRSGDMTCSEASMAMRSLEAQEEISSIISDLSEDNVAIPPLFDLHHLHRGMSALCARTGRNVFELVTPLSLPGQRLQQALVRSAINHGCRLFCDRVVTRLQVEGARIVAARIETPTRTQRVSFNSMILATGNLVGGGLILRGQEVIDPFSIFKVGRFGEIQSLPEQTGYDTFMRSVVESGYLVTNEMRLIDKDGKPFENAFGAGAALASFSFPTGVGLGGELLTAWVAAKYAGEVS